MNTKFYKQMLAIKRDNEWSSREMAAECGLCYGTFIEFFNVDKPFRPLRDTTMMKIHKRLGISYETMEEYNRDIKRMRKERSE